MSSFSQTLVLFVVNFAIIFGQYQPDVCLWNVVNPGTTQTYTHVNGLYKYEELYLNVKPLYNNSNPGCNKPPLYIYFKLKSWYLGAYPTGDAQNITGLSGKCISEDVTIQDPISCPGKWEIPYVDGSNPDSKIKVHGIKCPAWTDDCTKLEVTITNGGNANCQGTFVYDNSFAVDNVYSRVIDDTSTYYWFFNHNAFQWICADKVNLDSCAFAFGTDATEKSYNTDYWTNLDVTKTTSVNLDSGKTLELVCTQTADPSPSPTKGPLPPGEDDNDSGNQMCILISIIVSIVSIFYL
eukprot:240655_1